MSAAPRASSSRNARRGEGVLLALLALAAPPAPASEVALEAGRFLVASRSMGDPRFAHTVILIVAHGADGALGLVVNRPTGIALSGALPGLEGTERGEEPLWYGGPVEPARAAVLVAGEEAPQPSRTVIEGLHYSTAAPVLEALTAAGNGGRFRVYAGYAGWAPGQLEGELARGDWTLAPASVEEVFGDDGMRFWQRLIGAEGTWVRRPDAAGSLVLAAHRDVGQAAVFVHPQGHQHGAAAHGAVLDVLRVSGGAVQRERHRGPAEGAGG